MSLPSSLSQVRAYLLVPGIVGATVLAGCADQQPTGVDSASMPALSVAATATPGSVTLIARSPGNPRAVDGKTAFLLSPYADAGWARIEAEIVNGEAVFDFANHPQFKINDRVLAGIEFNFYANFLEQRTSNFEALFAPFDVPNATPQATPLSNSLTYYSAFFTAVGGNNAIPKTVDNLNAILENQQSASWITLTSSAQKLQPITFPQGGSGYAPGRVRSTIVDRNGNTVSFSGNVFGVQELSGTAKDLFRCNSATLNTSDQKYKDWFCSLPTALFSVEGTAANGIAEFVLPHGSYFLDVKGKDRNGRTVNIVRPSHVKSGEVDEGVSMAVPPVRSSYVMQPFEPSAGPNLPYSRGGFESDGAKPDNLTGFIQGYWTVTQGPITVRWTFVENPGQSGSKTTVVDLACGTAAAPTSCKQVSSGKAYLHGGTFSAATGKGQGVLSIPQGSKTTAACATVAVWNGTAFVTVPAPTRHQNSRCASGGAFMEIGTGNGNTFKLM